MKRKVVDVHLPSGLDFDSAAHARDALARFNAALETVFRPDAPDAPQIAGFRDLEADGGVGWTFALSSYEDPSGWRPSGIGRNAPGALCVMALVLSDASSGFAFAEAVNGALQEVWDPGRPSRLHLESIHPEGVCVVVASGPLTPQQIKDAYDRCCAESSCELPATLP